MPRIALLLAALALLAAMDHAGAAPPVDRLGSLDFPACVELRGNRSFDADRIRRALARDALLVSRLHPLMPVRDATRLLGEVLGRSYGELGFLDVRIDVRWDVPRHVFAVTVVEGRRFELAELRVEGASPLPKDELLAALREKMDAGSSGRGGTRSFRNGLLKELGQICADFAGERGFLAATVRHRIERRPEAGRADLVFAYAPLGAPARLASVVFRGGDRHPRAALEELAALPVGRTLTTTAVRALVDRFRASGRFLEVDARPATKDETTGRTELVATLVDYPASPPLGAKSSEAHRCLLALASWLEGLDGRDEAFRFTASPALCKGFALSGLLSLRRGLLVTLQCRQGRWPLDLTALVTPGKVALLDDRRREKLILDGLSGQLVTSLSMAPTGESTGADLFRGGLGFTWQGKDDATSSGLVFRADLAPVALLGLATKSEALDAQEDDASWTLRLTGETSEAALRVRRRDGALLELDLRPRKGTGSLLRLVPTAVDFEGEIERGERRSRSWPSLLRPGETLQSTGSVVLEQLLRIALALGERPGPWPTETLRGLVFHPLLDAVARRLDGDAPKLPGEDFEPATEDMLPARSPLALFAPALAWLASSRGPFVSGSWPRKLGRCLLAATTGFDGVLPWELQELDRSDDAGPLARLLMAHACRLFAPAAVPHFAARGLEELEARGLHRDLRLLSSHPFLRGASGAVLDALRRLEDGRLEGLARGLPAEEGKLLRRLGDALKESRGVRGEELVETCLKRIDLSPVAKDLEKALKELATRR